MKKRLHEVEGLLELISTDPWIFQPSELYEISGELRDELKRYNLYLVARRNRISMDIQSLFVTEGGESVSGNFSVYIQDTVKKVPFKFPSPVEGKITAIGETEYPHSFLRLLIDDQHPIQLRTHEVIRFSEHSLATFADLKVEYVGQSFGKGGSSDAMARLIGKTGKQGHGSLQKVLADLNKNHPDQEVHILLYSYESYKNYIQAGGHLEPVHDIDHDEGRLDTLMNAEYSKENRIDLAEASLIRYFSPTYNDIFKKTFPQKTHDMLQSLFNYDVTGLAVSLSTMEHNLRVYSDSVSASSMHCPSFSIVKDSERASFLDLSMTYA